ncbi:MAG: NADH-quinone oxidoreductase subunit J [Chlamydiae bacterium]|nr:NADH-quinone oxidoreductase subunit J [Chlamydiota bacterium]MBI3277823.1 NADH-quinone oxidoreductase subunit J [Chlamydiota bacterium]
MKDIAFISLSMMTLASAIMAVSFKKVLYNAFSLMLCLAGIAGIFLFLSSEFLAVMEIIVYVGAIAIAIIFAIMFSPPHFMTQPDRKLIKTLRSIVVGLFFFLALYKATTLTPPWIEFESMSQNGDYSIEHLGKILLGVYTLPFEVIGIILFIAILGALIMAKKRGSNE